MKAKTMVVAMTAILIVGLGCGDLGRGTTWGEVQRLEFDPDELPETLYTMITGDPAGPVLTYCLPSGYSPDRTYPLVLYVPGNHGRRGGSIQNAMDIADGHDCVVASLPLFKAAVDRREVGNGLPLGFGDFPTLSRAYGVMLQRLDEAVPNLDRSRSAMVGFSNGAIATALLVSCHDENILQRFHCFCLVDHGMFHLGDLHRALARDRRYLVLVGDQFDLGRDLKLRAGELMADAYGRVGVDIEYRVLEGTGHELTRACKTDIGRWIFAGE